MRSLTGRAHRLAETRLDDRAADARLMALSMALFIIVGLRGGGA
jgi:hypothetical protein